MNANAPLLFLFSSELSRFLVTVSASVFTLAFRIRRVSTKSVPAISKSVIIVNNKKKKKKKKSPALEKKKENI